MTLSDYIWDVLDQAVTTVAEVTWIYERDVAKHELSSDLKLRVRTIVQDCQSALDATATRVKNAYLTKSGRSPYYPFSIDAQKFNGKMEAELRGLLAKEPDIAKAFERHQPYQPGKKELGYLKKLARVNKHQDFSPQYRKTTRQLHVPAGARMTNDGKIIVIPDDLIINIHGPADMTISPVAEGATARILVGWNFINPDVDVLLTLIALTRLTREAVQDIRHVAAV